MQKRYKTSLFFISCLGWLYVIRSSNIDRKTNHSKEADNRSPKSFLNQSIKESKNIIRLITTKCSDDIDLSGEFNEMQKKWKYLLVSDTYDDANRIVVQYVKMLSKEAENLYSTFNRALYRRRLWPTEPDNTASAELNTHFAKLLKLTFSYGTKGTKYYKNPQILSTIKDGLNFLIYKKSYDGNKYYGNWWDWQIGVPLNFIRILIVLNDELTISEKYTYTKAISSYVPNPFQQMYTMPQGKLFNLSFIPKLVTTGANRANLAQITLGLGIVQKNCEKIIQALDSLLNVMTPVNEGDGFYKDGSFIQHKNIPYTDSYGNYLVRAVCKVLWISKDTRYEMNSKVVESFVDIVENAFIPLIYKGELISSVNGRCNSRAPDHSRSGYGSTMHNLLLLSKITPTRYRKTKLMQAVKYWMMQNPIYYFTYTEDYSDLSMTITLLNDTSIQWHQMPFIGAKLYASMDRFVQRTLRYMVGLGLYSSRISSFEAGNKENKRGWHAADGMIYLYNDDEVQFNKAYWPTIDPYRLPGTTVDTVPLKDEVTSFLSFTSHENWVGGVSNQNQAVIGMSLNKTGTKNNGIILSMNLHGKKSWFFVDGLFVALGAGITGDTAATIETVVDNRLLNKAYEYQILFSNDGINVKKEWLLLQADHDRASIGYYFLEEVNIDAKIEQRRGTYKEINEHFSSKELYVENYAKFSINHGSNPKNSSYAYVVLPGIHLADLKYFGDKGSVVILENTLDIQAVYLKDFDYLGINVWKETGGEVTGIKVDQPVSLLKQKRDKQTVYTVSDPTQSNRLTKLRLTKDFTNVVSMSEGITYDNVNNIFKIDFRDANGASKTIVVS